MNFYRCEITEVSTPVEDFLNDLRTELQDLLKHDFLAKSQASYFKKKKEEIKEEEIVVSLDFAENYSFFVQNAIQSHHWTNNQATLHPFVIYHRENGQIKNLNFVIISEKVAHDTSSVHLFNTKLIEFLKTTFPNKKINKIYYFSDGAASQYKNKYNFINLALHEKDFEIKAEWNFFATSHGKGACDGIGGSVKRQAKRASLQRVNTNHITTAQHLFHWAQIFFKKINFAFCTTDEHEIHDREQKIRFQNALTIKNTRAFHHYKPIDKKQMECKIFSEDTKSVTNVLFQIQEKKKSKNKRVK